MPIPTPNALKTSADSTRKPQVNPSHFRGSKSTPSLVHSKRPLPPGGGATGRKKRRSIKPGSRSSPFKSRMSSKTHKRLQTNSAVAVAASTAKVVVSPKIRKFRRRSQMMSRSSPQKVKSMGALVAAGAHPGAVVSSVTNPPAQPVPSSANIRVAVRVRPENEREKQFGQRNVIEIIDDQMLIFDPKVMEDEFYYKGKLQQRRDINKKQKKNHKFAYDVVFGPESTNQQVFEKTTKDLVDVLFEGYNCSVFVYGSTGAGKTFTMLGSESNPGLTFRTVLELYQRLDQVPKDVQCEIRISYLEVYNETVIDLIHPGNQLGIRDDGKNGVQIPGLSMHKPEGPEDLLKLLHFGNGNRTQHPTDANAESSRSHAVFQVYLTQKSRNENLETEVKVAKLSMIDLAGSERGTVAMAGGNVRLREGANINRSLLALGNCITALADGSKYVPFRDSKLTRLLKDSIGGNCRTVMISNVTPNALQFEDTYNTLKYADRAKRIKIKLKKNILGSGDVTHYVRLVDSLKVEVTNLKSKITVLEGENQALLSKQDPQREWNGAGETSELQEQLSAEKAKSEEREKRIAELESRLAELLQPKKENSKDISIKEVSETVLEEVEMHKSLLLNHTDTIMKKKKLKLKLYFIQKILTRSQQISLSDDPVPDKITNRIEALTIRLRKLAKKEKISEVILEQSKQSLETKLNELEAEHKWQVKSIRSDLSSLTLGRKNDHILETFEICLEEVNRIDNIVSKCLPMLKDKYLLLSSYENKESDNEIFRNFISLVQCTTVQFSLPGINQLTSESSPEPVPTPVK